MFQKGLYNGLCAFWVIVSVSSNRRRRKIYRRYLVSGGAGFIGSHFVSLVLADPNTEHVTVIDNFYLGSRENLAQHADDPRLTLIRADASDMTTIIDIVKRYSPEIYCNFDATYLTL